MLLAFSAVLLLLTVAATGMVSNRNLAAAAQDITGRRLTLFDAANVLTVSALQAARHTRNLLILDDDQRAAEVESTRKQRQVRQLNLTLIRQGVASPEGKALVAAIDEADVGYEAPEEQYLKMVETGEKAAARGYLLDTMRPAQLKLLKAVENFAAFQKRRMGESAAGMQADVGKTQVIVVFITVLSLLVSGGVGYALSASIVKPIARAVEVAETVAQGDLTSTIHVDRKDETGRLLAALKTMNANLASVVGEVRKGSESMALGTSEIAAGNADLSQRTEEQAASLQQTAASMEQLNVTVRNSAETALSASRLANRASTAAAQGGTVVSDFVVTMSDITASSRRIADIIGVIDGIAFQTNILALNAAVEAARAGEQGRGFAVVASEVRSLAQRSAAAAKEIKGLISESAAKVESGSVLVSQARKTMDDLVGQVQQVSGMIGEISNAAREQATGITLVNTAVTQLDQVTQQNAALVEESAAAADSLKQQSQLLVQAVARFRIGGEALRA